MMIQKQSENILRICFQDEDNLCFSRQLDTAAIDSEEARDLGSLKIRADKSGFQIRIEAKYDNAYGLGERFDRVNRKGTKVTVHVLEKFCCQGEYSYCPIPFFFTDTGFGLYIDTKVVTNYSFEDSIVVDGLRDSHGQLPDIYLFTGEPEEIISAFSRLTGEAALPPRWAFGPWISANRWNSITDIEEQLSEIKKEQFPVNVLVIEAWSDEITFYIWNGSGSVEKNGSERLVAGDFTYDEKWQSPQKLIERLHEMGIRLILWQIPVLKKPDGIISKQHENDRAYALKQGLCVRNPDGTPYLIPEGHWFAGSMLPDFTNPETIKWWFGKRQYLLDMGVDGFKTDGGEFIYTEDALFHDGSTSIEMKNGYVKSYLDAYYSFVGKDRVLFSRSGYTGQQVRPIQWAGDQQSTWEELRHDLAAGLSAGLSGILFWSFDIAGFAGKLPSAELYERATQLAVFCPVMQWHSEPEGGQFSGTMAGEGGVNDRSPWNMARVSGDAALVKRLQFNYNLRMNLLPYIYAQATECTQTGLPLMRHLAVNDPGDKIAYEIEDEFMLGDILVAPILYEGQKSRSVYLPTGGWHEFFSGKPYKGGQWHEFTCGYERIPAFVKEGCAIALNLGESMELGSSVGNNVDEYKNLCFWLSGKAGTTHFADGMGNDFSLSWEDRKINIKGMCTVTVHTVSNLNRE